MKKIPLLTAIAGIALLTQAPPGAHASTESKKRQAAKVAEMCRDREVRMMTIHMLTSTPAGKKEVAKVLREKGYSVRYPNAEATGAAEGQTVNRAINNLD